MSNPMHEKFGATIADSRWFNGEPTIEREKVETIIEKWMCPIDGCGGEMKFNGSMWASNPGGYHHTCAKCGFTAALAGVKYPRKVPVTVPMEDKS